MILHRDILALVGLAGLLSAAAACGDPVPTDPGSYEPYEPAELQPLDCVPNLDGRLDADELTPRVDIPVRYLVSPAGQTRPVDLDGRVTGSGRTLWDWSTEAPSDQLATVEATAIDQTWFADRFPGGQFVVGFDLGGRILGVYSRTDQALRLHGLASATPEPPEGRTLLVYEDPVELYRFPLEPGRSWVSTGVIRNSEFQGLPYAGRDIYEIEVVDAGELWLPDLRFTQAHQVRTKVTNQPSAGQSQSTYQVSFLFECFGEVARATSQLGESDPNFTTAAEVRRLGISND